jgi:putative endonuclease
MKQPAVYMLASGRNGTLYVGVTSDLVQRTWQHKEHLVNGFSEKHGVEYLICFELHATMNSAITREKQIKKWNREWKVRLIEEANPYRNDLWPQIVG